MRMAAAALALSALFCSAARAAQTDADAVKALELKRFEAATHDQVDAVARLLADDLTYVHSSGVVEDKAKYIDSLRTGKLKYQSIEPTDMQVRVYGTTAIITASARVSIVSDGQPKTMSVRYTDV